MSFLDSLTGVVKAVAPIAVPTINTLITSRARERIERDAIRAGFPGYPPGTAFPAPTPGYGAGPSIYPAQTGGRTISPMGGGSISRPPMTPVTYDGPQPIGAAPINPPEAIVRALGMRTGSPVVSPAVRAQEVGTADVLRQILEGGVLSMLPGGGGGEVMPMPAPSMGCAVGPMSCSSLFEPTCHGTLRAAREVTAINPQTGKIHFFKNAGRPVLWSSDLAAAKRVRKVASKAARSMPRRRTTRRR